MVRINSTDPNIIFDENLFRKVKEYIVSVTIDASEMIYSLDRSISLPSLSTTYVDLFSDFGGRPFVIDTSGYTHGTIHIYWNKNGGAGTHSLRIIKHANPAHIMYEKLDLANGENLDVDVVPSTPSQFLNFAGKLRIQVKSSNGTDSPVFESIRVYLRS